MKPKKQDAALLLDLSRGSNIYWTKGKHGRRWILW